MRNRILLAAVLVLVAVVALVVGVRAPQGRVSPPSPVERTAPRASTLPPLISEPVQASAAAAPRRRTVPPFAAPFAAMPMDQATLDWFARYDYPWQLRDWQLRMNAYVATCMPRRVVDLSYFVRWRVSDRTVLDYGVQGEPPADPEDAATFTRCIGAFLSVPENAPLELLSTTNTKLWIGTFKLPLARLPIYQVLADLQAGRTPKSMIGVSDDDDDDDATAGLEPSE
jgi:hypothetical protein